MTTPIETIRQAAAIMRGWFAVGLLVRDVDGHQLAVCKDVHTFADGNETAKRIASSPTWLAELCDRVEKAEKRAKDVDLDAIEERLDDTCPECGGTGAMQSSAARGSTGMMRLPSGSLLSV